MSQSASLNAPLTASAFSSSSSTAHPQTGSGLDFDVESGEGICDGDGRTCTLSSEAAECSICLEKLTCSPVGLEVADVPCDVTTAPCGHAFHERCLRKWLTVSNHCPVCRSDVEDETVNNRRRSREQARTGGRRAGLGSSAEAEGGAESTYSSSAACFVAVLHTFLFLQQTSSFVCSLWFAVCGEPLLCAWCLFSASGKLRLVALSAFALLFCGMSAFFRVREPPMIHSQSGWEAEVSAIAIAVNLSLLMTSAAAERMLDGMAAERDSGRGSDVREPRRRRTGRRVLLLSVLGCRTHRGGRGEAPYEGQAEETVGGTGGREGEAGRRLPSEERSDRILLAAAAAA